jgi:hypothetical protein
MLKDKVLLIEANVLPSAGFAGVYLPFNAAGLPYSCFELRIINASNQNVFISMDGVVVHEYVIAGETRVLNGQASSGPNNHKAYFPKGFVLYALSAAGAGSVYLAGSYQPQG